MKKQENGITLIALVITIIVMLILAGVTISLLLEDDGIIEKAQKVRAEQAKAEAEEKLELLSASLKIEELTSTSESNVFISRADGDDGGLTEFLLDNGVLIAEDALIIENGDKTLDFEVCAAGYEISGENVYYILNIPCEAETGDKYFVKTVIEIHEDEGKYILKEAELVKGIEEVIANISNDIKVNPDKYLTGATSNDDREEKMWEKLYSVYVDNDLVVDAEYVNAEGTGFNLVKLTENSEISGYSYIFTVPCSKDGERAITKIMMTAGENYKDKITMFWSV